MLENLDRYAEIGYSKKRKIALESYTKNLKISRSMKFEYAKTKLHLESFAGQKLEICYVSSSFRRIFPTDFFFSNCQLIFTIITNLESTIKLKKMYEKKRKISKSY